MQTTGTDHKKLALKKQIKVPWERILHALEN